jgi:hypothetical protein
VLGDEKSDSVTCSFFGDGTCNVGQFYESLNMAALYKLPHIFVVENNLWAIGMSHLRSTSHTMGDADFPYIYKKGPAFGMPGVRVDGMDVLKVRCGGCGRVHGRALTGRVAAHAKWCQGPRGAAWCRATLPPPPAP